VKKLISPVAVLFAFALSFPAFRQGFNGSLGVDEVLLRFLLAVVCASVGLAVVRAVVESFSRRPAPAVEASQPGPPPAGERRKAA
jgi:hypothetical protein